ncbi:MAG: PAS domain S-box protein, partial [Desulfomonilaceae bacterium]
MMGDNDFPNSNTSEEDESPRLLADESNGTETLDLSSLLTRDLTFSGSFDIRGDIWATTFGKLTQSLPLPALLIDQSCNIVVANQACGRISREYETILDAPFSGLFPDPSTARKVQALAEEVFANRKPRIGEGIIKIGKGKIWGRITLRSIRIMENRLVLVLVEDLTPQKQQLVLKHKLNEELKREIAQRERAESRLAESEKKYRGVVETAGDVIYQTDRRGLFTLVNQVGLKITGYAAEELIGTSYLDLIPPDHRKTVERFYGIQFVKGLPITYYEFPLVTKQGKTVWLGQNVQLLTEDEEVVGFQAIARDITDRKRAEEALLESETRYKDLFDHASDGIYTVDPQGNFTSGNEAATRMLRYSREELLRVNFKDLVDPDYLPVVEENFRKKIQNGAETTGPYEVLVHPKEGTPLWLDVTSRVITKGGKPVGVHGSARDVTERKRLEERLRQAAKMEAIGTLAGGLAHDFNNLLQIVLGYADLIVIGKEKQEKDYQRARLIHDAATRGRDLVNRILTFSRRVET